MSFVSLFFTESKITPCYDNNAVSKELHFQLSKMSPEKILSILNGLNPSKAAGIANWSSTFLKNGAHFLARPIRQLFNISIKLNCFPRSFKIVKVKPIFKKGSETDPQNYRPISLLPLISKIIERIVHDQVRTNFCTGFNRVFEKNALQTLVLDISLIKLLPVSKKIILPE